jgi:DNA (cytosine-5)-methyltransferase 1
VEEPLPTIATAGAISLIEPSLVSYYGASDETTSVDRPLPTVTTKARFGLCRPMVVKLYGTSSTASVEEPVPTVTAGGTHLGLCQPFIVPQFGEAEGQAPRLHDVAAPLPAVTGHGAGALVQPLVLQMAQVGRSDDGMVRHAGQPLPTITAHNNTAVATPVLAPSAEGMDPRRLVEIDGQVYALDIRFRMLTNKELARAMGFEGYTFTGNVGEVTRQIGNAVCVNLAAALVTAILGERAASTETEGVA